MPSIGSEEGSVDGCEGGEVSVLGEVIPVSVGVGTFEIDTSVQLKINPIKIYLIFSSKVVDSRGIEPLSALVLV